MEYVSRDITLMIDVHSFEYYPHGFEVGIYKVALPLFYTSFVIKYSYIWEQISVFYS